MASLTSNLLGVENL